MTDELKVVSVSDKESHLQVIGCAEMLLLVRNLRDAHGVNCKTWPMPSGNSHSEILLREALLRDRGEWDYPYKEDELCHCRNIPASVVDEAIIYGCHTPQRVSKQTSASTACGTCRPDVEKMIKYRVT